MRNILITGGAGFIGSNFIIYYLKKYSESVNIINLDCLTYASNISNLNSIKFNNNYKFLNCNICNYDHIYEILLKYKPNIVLHLAAESHVDRSITDPILFVNSNVNGTVNLLNACLKIWNKDFSNKLFYHISTDEVFGSLNMDNRLSFKEDDTYNPSSPYSASKAASDHLVMSYYKTYGLPVIISRCSNNFGPHQSLDKFIPLIINCIINNRYIPIYGNGTQIRNWIYVLDHISAIDCIINKGNIGETYNIGTLYDISNIDLVKNICDKISNKTKISKNIFTNLVKFVNDRPGHDIRYSINSKKIRSNLGWQELYTLDKGLDLTIDWYLSRLKNKIK